VISRPKKMIVLGIDGCYQLLLKKLVNNYDLPGFSYILTNFFYKDLISTIPPLSATAWISLYSGLIPDKHEQREFIGINSDYEIKPMKYGPVKMIWDYLSTSGFKSIIVNTPMIYPAPKIDGVFVCGWPSPTLSYYPDSIENLITSSNFITDVDGIISLFEKSPKKAISKLIDSTVSQKDLFLELLKKYPNWDFGMVVLNATDRVQHYTNDINDSSYIYKIYKEIDNFIVYWKEHLYPRGVELIIVSDHGFTPIKKAFLINRWLVKCGYQYNKINIFDILLSNPIIRYLLFKLHPIIYSKHNFIKKIKKYFIDEFKKSKSFNLKNSKVFSISSASKVADLWLNDNRFSNSEINDFKEKKQIIKKLKYDLNGLNGIVKDVFENDIKLYRFNDYIYPDLTIVGEKDIIIISNEGIFQEFIDNKDDFILKPPLYRTGDHDFKGVFFSSFIPKPEYPKSNMLIFDVLPVILDFYDININTLECKR